MPRPETTHLAWVDLETTGTDEVRDDIIEFACVVTDLNLNAIWEYETVVRPESSTWLERVYAVDAVRDMHTANGLLGEIAAGAGEDLFDVDQFVTDTLRGVLSIEPHAIMLAGSGVGHFDSRFIKVKMSGFAKMLAYPVIDVGVMRRFLRDICGRPDMVPESGDGATKTHRAYDDIVLHLSEARYYRRALGEAFDNGGVHPIGGEKL